MWCCNLLNYVYILVREKKQKEIRNKTHAHHTYLRTPVVLLHGPAAGLLPHACVTICMHCERRCGAAARAHHRLAALLPSACMRPVYLSKREPRALRACAAVRYPHTRAAALPSAASAEARRAEHQKANRSTRRAEHQRTRRKHCSA
jgi:hypothetical protein